MSLSLSFFESALEGEGQLPSKLDNRHAHQSRGCFLETLNIKMLLISNNLRPTRKGFLRYWGRAWPGEASAAEGFKSSSEEEPSDKAVLSGRRIYYDAKM